MKAKKPWIWIIANVRQRKTFLKQLIISAAIFVLMILCLSPLSKYLIEKYDERYTGRQITLDWIYINPFTGFVYFDNLKIYENGKDTVFFSAKNVSADFALFKLLSNTIEISELTLSHPRGTVIQNKNHFNFDDLIVRFSPDKSIVKKTPTHFNILRIKLQHGEFYYHEKVIPIKYWIKDLSMDCSGKRWNADTISSTFSFLSQNEKGGIKGHFTIDVVNQDYKLTTVVRNFDLEIIRQYLWELINYGMFSAQLDAKIKASGNFKNPENINMSGRFLLKDFHLGKSMKNNYAAFDKLLVVMDQVNPLGKKFNFDSVILTRPFFKYEIFDSLDNVQMLLGKRGSNISDVTSQVGRFNLVIEIGRYLKKLTKYFFESHYQINKLLVSHGTLKFSDFSLSEQFTTEANSLSIRADSVNKNKKRIGVFIRSRIKPFGDASVDLTINPKDSGDFDMTYRIGKIPVSAFNPYLISYASFPLDRGTLEFNGTWNVREGQIKSVNHMVVVDPRVATRIKNKDLKWIPLPLIMAFVRERSNVIDYEIPISGNLKKPHFHLRDVILDLLKNIFVKPVTVPYGIALKNTESKIENSITLRWDMRQRLLHPNQVIFVEKMAMFLKKNADASITIYPNDYSLKEREYILFFQAKKKYWLSNHPKDKKFSKQDSIEVEKMSIKDRAFVHVLKKGVSDTMLFSIQEKCINYLGNKNSDVEYARLLEDRIKAFRSFFINNGTEKRLLFSPAVDGVPYNGFSYFKISYSGDAPLSLQRAYDKMNQINDENPRKKYFKKEGD